VLTLWLPGGAGGRASEVWLYAGVPGQQASVAEIGPAGGNASPSKQVSVVEGPLTGGKGYVLEARVPWSALPGGQNHALARGALRLHDVDGQAGTRPVVIASASAARPVQLPGLLIEGGPNAAVRDFLAHKQLASDSARHDLIGQVAGDSRLERVVIASTFVLVAGSDLDAKAGYHFMDLPVTSAADVLAAELRDLTGDGKDELVLRLEQRDELGTRELLDVLALAPGQPRVLFAAVLGRRSEQGSAEAKLALEPAANGKPGAIALSIGSARGLDASTYSERPPAGIEPLITPWGAVARRTYSWDGKRFALASEQPNPNAVQSASASTAGTSTSTSKSKSAPAASRAARTTEPEPGRVVHAEPPGMDQLVAAFRADRAIAPDLRPRFVQHANVAEDARIESLMLFGKDLLVIGKGFRAGTGYFYFGLPVQDGSDVQRVFTADVTGDGRRELFVRHKQRIGDVQRELLWVYRFDEQGIAPLLRVEVRRAAEAASIGNIVDIVPDGRHWALRVSPGRARGWDASSYPFVSESSDEYTPLLLPWKDRAVRYRFDGSALVAR
ncbi:MAG TPA: hypothetical protein VK509_18895, partial [Polyangiales bacterium]|nr:hypothetical protein [Polyangiales bacterium]